MTSLYTALLMLLAATFCCGTVFGKVDYTGHKVYRVTSSTHNAWRQLTRYTEQHYLDVWKEAMTSDDVMDIRVPPGERMQFEALLQTGKLYDYHVMIDDVQQAVDAEWLAQQQQTHNASRYYDLSEIHEYLDEMAVICGEECSTESIGSSYEGRDLYILKIGEAGMNNRSSIWIDCGIHAREWIAPATCQYIIDRLISDVDSDDVTATLRDLYNWYVHPVVNPDGYDYTWTDDRMWRKTRKPNNDSICIGTDGNRNFDLGFGGEGSNADPCSQTYKGTEAFSEVETAALDNYVKPMGSEFILALTIHSYGQFFVYPWGYTTDEDPDNIEQLARVAQAGEDAINGVHDMDYIGRRSNGDMAGNTIDWARGSVGIPYAYLFELRDTGDHGFLLPPEFIEPTGEEIWAGVQAMALEIAAIEEL